MWRRRLTVNGWGRWIGKGAVALDLYKGDVNLVKYRSFTNISFQLIYPGETLTVLGALAEYAIVE